MTELVTVNQWKVRQHRLNLFTKKYIKGVGPIPEDGRDGPLTQKRIKHCQWWLGWNDRDGKWSDKLHFHLIYPHSLGKGSRRVSPKTLLRGVKRRSQHNAWYIRTHFTSGVTTYDGVHVAEVAVPILQWCRAHGWRGRLVSGYRSPAYSQSLCYAMCGAPRCPGKCAGTSSNHVGTTASRFAVDVSDYYNFASVVRRCPLKPHIYNNLPSDPVHFSPTGN